MFKAVDIAINYDKIQNYGDFQIIIAQIRKIRKKIFCLFEN